MKPIRGPSALGGTPARFWALTKTLAITDFKLKFFGSVLGYLWQVMRPLLLFGVLYLVFTEFVRLGSGVKFYAVVLLTGIVLFTFFSEVTGGAVTSVVDRENLVRKIQFPRLVIPLAVLLTAYFNLALNFGVILVFAVASGVTPHWSWIEVPFLLLALGVFATGLAMLLSALYVRYRDVKPIWEVLLQLIFYGSPILYAIETAPNQNLAKVAMFNPLAAVIEQMRHAFIDPSAPSAGQAAGGTAYLLIPLAVTLGVVGLGFWYFNREAPRVAEEL
jgi:ABC-2 type transport system permease protein